MAFCFLNSEFAIYNFDFISYNNKFFIVSLSHETFSCYLFYSLTETSFLTPGSCWIEWTSQTQMCYSNLFSLKQNFWWWLGKKPHWKTSRREPPLNPKEELGFRRPCQEGLSWGRTQKGVSTHVGAIRGKMSTTCQNKLTFNHYKIA